MVGHQELINEAKMMQAKIEALEKVVARNQLRVGEPVPVKEEKIEDHPKYVALLKECEYHREMVGCLYKELRVPEENAYLLSENEQLRKEIAILHNALKTERELDGEDQNSARKRRLSREAALVFQRRCLEDSHKNMQSLMSRQIMKSGMEYAFKHAICLVRPEGGVESTSESENSTDEDGNSNCGMTQPQFLGVGQVALSHDTVDGQSQPKRRFPTPATQELKAEVVQAVIEEVQQEPKEQVTQEQVAKKEIKMTVKKVVVEPKNAQTSPQKPNAKEELRAKVAAATASASASPTVEKKQVEVVHNTIDRILRKTCFDDEEVIPLTDDIERLITETYTKKVTFDDDEQSIEEGELVEEVEVKGQGQGIEQGDAPLKLVPAPEEVEDPVSSEEDEPDLMSSEEDEPDLMSSEDEEDAKKEPALELAQMRGEDPFIKIIQAKLSKILPVSVKSVVVGQLRKKTFDEDEIVTVLDEDIEKMISNTYSTSVSFDDE